MRGVRIEETAAVRSDHLDSFLRSDWSLCDGLLHPFQRRRIGVWMQILNYSLRTQQQCSHDAQRQKNVESRACEIYPEVSDCLGTLPCETTHKCDGDG